MNPKDWIPIFISQTASTMTYWNVYIVVAIGFVGYLTQAGIDNSINTNVIAAVWVIFSVSNLVPMCSSQRTLSEVYAKLGEFQYMFNYNRPLTVAASHIVFDILMLIFIYFGIDMIKVKSSN